MPFEDYPQAGARRRRPQNRPRPQRALPPARNAAPPRRQRPQRPLPRPRSVREEKPAAAKPAGKGNAKPKVPIMEQQKTYVAVTAALVFALGSIGLPNFMDWFKTREETSIEVPPPIGRVDRFSALVTGTASSDFDIHATADCGGVGGIRVENNWHAVATVANKVGDFTVQASADRSQVMINLERFPQLESGLQLDRTRTDSHESSFLTACAGGDIVRVTRAMMRTAQATADTIGDCVVARPDFQMKLEEQLEAFGRATYPGASVDAIIPPYDGSISPARTALDALRAEVGSDGISIESSPIENCEFAEFTMTPIVFTLEGQNG